MNNELIISNFSNNFKNEARIAGVMVGIVTKNDSANDKDKPGAGLVKVKIPAIGMAESNWARIASFMAGKERGAFFLPEVEDEVLVAFENGDVNKPYIIGALWNGKDLPPETNSDGKNNTRVIKSRSGHTVQFFDKKDEEKIVIKSSKGHLIQIDDKSGAESIQITSTKDMKICAPKGKLVLEAQNIEIKASADMIIKGATVNIN